jgi:hypothetical protein
MLMIRQLNIYMASSCKVGFVDILVQYNAYMTREVNSLDKICNGYSKLLALRTYAQPAKNAQSNAICERMHQTAIYVLKTLVHTNPPCNMTQARDIIDDALATAMHAMQTAIATTLGSTPGALAFAWDMFLNVPLIADWQAIAHTCEHHVNENLRRANRKWHQFDYAPGQQVLNKVHNPTKLGVRTEGPYTIERINVNSNLTILLREGITECINICRGLV